jgi:hypothetical protein
MVQGGNSRAGVERFARAGGRKSSLLLSLKKEDSSFSEEKETVALILMRDLRQAGKTPHQMWATARLRGRKPTASDR